MNDVVLELVKPDEACVSEMVPNIVVPFALVELANVMASARETVQTKGPVDKPMMAG